MRPTHALLLLVASSAVGCGGAPPPPPHPTTPPAHASAAPSASPAPAKLAGTAPEGAASSDTPVSPAGIGIGGLGRRGGQEAVARPHVAPIPFRIADLPSATIPDAFQQNQTGAGVPNLALGDAPADLTITANASDGYRAQADDRSVVVSIKDAAFAQIRIGPWVGWAGGVYGASGGAYVRCGNRGGVALLVPARWETLKTRAGGADYGVADGWFDRAQCKASVVRRAAATAKPLVPGQTIYAFRACGATCAEKQSLVLIMPRAQSIVATGVGGDAQKEVGAFTRVTLPLRRGGGGSMMARVAMPDLLAWRAAMAPDDKSAKAGKPVSFGSFVASVLVGVEVVQGVDDAEPVAIVYQDPADPLASGDVPK